MEKQTLVEKFAHAGIKLKINKTNPDEEIILSLSSERKFVSIYTQQKNLSRISALSLSKKHKQVLIAIDELGSVFRTNYQLHDLTPPDTNKEIKRYFMDHHGVVVPTGTRYAVEYEEFAGKKAWFVAAYTPSKIQKYLIGYDEEHLFISSLKDNAVNTVDEARKSLIPKKCVGKKYLRQGEFFFVPMKYKDYKAFMADDRVIMSMHHANPLKKDGINSDHEVIGVKATNIHGKQIVMGSVSNERHRTLELETFHEVFVANENASFGNNFD